MKRLKKMMKRFTKYEKNDEEVKKMMKRLKKMMKRFKKNEENDEEALKRMKSLYKKRNKNKKVTTAVAFLSTEYMPFCM